MNFKHYIIAVFLTFFALACKKIEPPVDEDEANEPIYLLEGLVNGDSLMLYVNDTTVFISNGPYNMNGVEAYSSTISDLETGFELKMTVLRPEIFIDEAGVKLIETGEMQFLVHEPICKNFVFSQGSSQGDYFGAEIDGITSNGTEIIMKEYGKYTANLTFPNISTNKYELPAEFGFKNEILNPYFETQGTGNVLSFTSTDSGNSHEWKLDEVIVSTNFDGERQVSNGIHRLSHTVVDSYQNTATYTTLVYFQNNQYKWTMSEEYCSTDVIENNYARVLIEVLYNGVKYTSVYNTENFNHSVKISNIVYLVSDESESIGFVKFNMNFNAQLKTIDNSKILNLENMNGTFHIAVN